MSRLDIGGLLDRLESPNKWVRQTALRLLYDRHQELDDEQIYKRLMTANSDQTALELLWALNATDHRIDLAVNGSPLTTNESAFNHPDPALRSWLIRLAIDHHDWSVDDRQPSGIAPNLFAPLLTIAKTESDASLISQLLCASKSMPVEQTMLIVKGILENPNMNKFADDPHLPLLLWWAIEAHCQSSHKEVIDSIKNSPSLWDQPFFQRQLSGNLLRRFAQSGKRVDLMSCASLLDVAPTEEAKRRLTKSFEQAFEGRSIAGLPSELTRALTDAGGGSLALRIRQGEQDAINQGEIIVANEEEDLQRRLRIIETFGQILNDDCKNVISAGLQSEFTDIRTASLIALQGYDDPEFARHILIAMPDLKDDEKLVAYTEQKRRWWRIKARPSS